jgi:two-component system, cell cycle sensor histidine kinase and response regulator CckA
VNVVTQSAAARSQAPDPWFEAMFEGAAIGIAICQLDGRILDANPALCTMLGYSRHELAGAHAREICPEVCSEICPEIRPQPCPELRPELERGLPPENTRHASIGGPSPVERSPDEQKLHELMRGERDSFEVEKRYRRKDGSELWGHLTLSVGRGTNRQPAFLIAMFADATERKHLEEQLRQAEKMEVVGRLAAGVAHDFNNLLTGVLLYCDLLSAGFQNAELNPGELSEHVDVVRMAGEHGAALTQQLSAIARKQATEPRPTPINGVVTSTKNLLRRLLGERIELIVVLDTALDTAPDTAPEASSETAPGTQRNSSAGLVLADPAQLRQILLNLVLNARDAMPQGGMIGLFTRAAEFPSPSAAKNSSASPNPGAARRAVSLRVKDNGCGMDVETRARLFEPFFTTKKLGEGTGLGLATVQRIVSELGGLIEVGSEPGRGTSIEVFLPAIDVSAPEGQLKVAQRFSAG